MSWRGVYAVVLWLALPVVLARLWLRARHESRYRDHWSERFGRYRDTDAPRPGFIWIHAVSLGELHAARPLIERLLVTYPDARLLLTQMTATGREAAEQAYGSNARVRICWLPYDYPFAVRRFFRHFKPRAGLIMETEVWANLLREARAQGVPMMLVNARLSEQSFRGYRRFDSLAREAFATFRLVAAQGAADAARLAQLGAQPIHVTGNLKFDTQAPAESADAVRALRALWGPRPVMLAASTRDGEEALLLDALDEALPADVLCVIVPRHPQRFDEVARCFEGRAIAYARRSDSKAVPGDCRYLLGDSVGEMAVYYGLATVAFVGGSLRDFGGQNFIEACAQGVPVLLGPHTRNFDEAARGAIECGAALRVQDARHLAQEARRLLIEKSARDAMSQAGRTFCAAHRGATQRVLALVGQLIGNEGA